MDNTQLKLLSSVPAILEASSEAVAYVNEAGQITGFNHQFLELVNIDEQQCRQLNIHDILSFEDDETNPDDFSGDFRPIKLSRLDGIVFWVLAKTIPISANNDHKALLIYDPESLRHVIDRLDYIEHHDVTTGLLNHDKGMVAFQRLLASYPNGGSLLIKVRDCDPFDPDKCLKTIASSIPVVNDDRSVCFRYSDNEIVYAFATDDSHRVQDFVSPILAFTESHQDTGARCTETAFSIWQKDALSNKELINRLKSKYQDISLADFKIDEEYDVRNTDTISYASLLETALVNNDLDFYIQPQICSDTRQVIGGELLVRWFKSDGEIVPPTMFVDFPEKGEFAEKFLKWSIQRIATILKDVHQLVGTWIPLSMNLSPAHIHDDELVRHLTAEIHRHRIPRGILEIEITERILAEDPDSVLRNLSYLSNEGFKIAIDDFGTGYSSLSYLRKFPINRLKIDRVFINNLEENEEDRLLITSIILLAHVLGLETIAEGVEDTFQASFLKDTGCEYFQGYLTGKPMPIIDFISFIKENKTNLSWQDIPINILKDKNIQSKAKSIKWKKSFSTDIVSIDNEHRILIDRLNRFIEAGGNQDEIIRVLDEISSEAMDHFNHEERIMRNINYPRYAAHAEKHKWLLADISKRRLEIENSKEDANFSEIVRYIKYWLLRHLVSEDTQLNRYMNKPAEDRRV